MTGLNNVKSGGTAEEAKKASLVAQMVKVSACNVEDPGSNPG